jgi:hypothetical protein
LSNYVQSTNFATKDTLSSGDPLKIVKGTEINTEFNNIATAVATKADLLSPTFTGTPALPTGTTAVTQSAANNTTAVATTAFVQAAATAVLQLLHPVGSVYINATDSTNPGTLFGFGTWVSFGAGRVPVGFDSTDTLFDTAEETGGSKDAIVVSHSHTTGSAGAASGTLNAGQGAGDWGSFRSAAGVFSLSNSGPNTGNGVFGGGSFFTATMNIPDHTHTVSTTGSSGTNANLQPYITVYMWKRTA